MTLSENLKRQDCSSNELTALKIHLHLQVLTG
jgi:hypothetical protein